MRREHVLDQHHDEEGGAPVEGGGHHPGGHGVFLPGHARSQLGGGGLGTRLARRLGVSFEAWD